jgi:hypothetical protein
MLSHRRLLEVLKYDPETGIFRWAMDRRGVRAGVIVGNKPTTVGYGAIRIDGRLYLSHRLAWFYVHRKWPPDQIDHINMDRIDNKISNLREATLAQNRMNESIKRSNTSGFKGVSWNKEKRKWEARIGHNRKSYFVGYFDTAVAAHEAWKKQALVRHGPFARAS